MTLAGDIVAGFLLESVLLAAVWCLLALAAALAAAGAASLPRDRDVLRRLWLWALIGAVASGSLAHRFGAAEPWLLSIGKRDVPMIWSMGGALAGAGISAVVARRAARLKPAAAAPADNPGGDGASPGPGDRTPR